jgi:HemY protein
MRSGLIDKRTFRRQRAVLLTAQAQALAESDRERAIALAREAAKLAPDLVPAAALAGRLHGEAGERRRAARIIERAWRANPHPDLAAAYAALRPGDSARQRLSRVETLAAKGPADAEAALAVARAALDAHEFAAARKALAPYTASPRKRVAALMAELEMAQGDEGRGREWMARALNARRDPAWTADAFVSDHWLPISPVSGRLDAFEWKDPLAGEDHGAVIEHRAEAPAVPAATPAVVETSPAGQAAAPGVTSPRARGEQSRPSAGVLSAKDADANASATSRSDPGEGGPPQAEASQVAPHPHPLPAGGEREPAQQADKPASEETEKAQRAAEEAAHADPFSAGGRSERRAMAAATADESRAPRGRAMPAVAPAVIPLVHAPDDPGPNGETEAEPAPEPAPPPADGWSRIRALFRP